MICIKTARTEFLLSFSNVLYFSFHFFFFGGVGGGALQPKTNVCIDNTLYFCDIALYLHWEHLILKATDWKKLSSS